MRAENRLRRFFLFNYVILFALLLIIAREGLDEPVALFLLAAGSGYALLYLGPVWLLTKLCGSLPGMARFQGALAVAGMTLLLLLLWLDAMVYRLYGFHLNGFVWNLITTPGGITSMGGGASSYWSLAMLALAVLGFEAGLLWFCGLDPARRAARLLPPARWIVTLLLVMMVGERFAYGLSHYKAYQPVLAAAADIPFYIPTTFQGFAREIGLKPGRRLDIDAGTEGRLDYPRAPLRVAEAAPSPDIVWLVAESLRADMLTPEIMPNLWRFSQRGMRFTNHYSGGNGTRMGIFSMFYGLPGSYWFSFLDARQPPVLITELQRRNYRFGLFTSARFTYPEFDKTVWSTMPSATLVEDEAGEGWERDRRNVERVLDFMAERDGERPTMTFMFFESGHAPYTFPAESVIRDEYLPELNYAALDVEQDIELVFNRYVNAAHHLDQQIGRVLEALEKSGRLDRSIVVVTGDHGEEFMELGRWGHNSAFHAPQIHTPLVLVAPGVPEAVVDAPTSHLDIVPTLMPMLGVLNPVDDYAQGISLLTPDPRRYRLVASWDALGYIGPDYKVALPLRAGGLFETTVSTSRDQPVQESDTVLAALQPQLMQVLRDMSGFLRPRG